MSNRSATSLSAIMQMPNENEKFIGPLPLKINIDLGDDKRTTPIWLKTSDTVTK